MNDEILMKKVSQYDELDELEVKYDIEEFIDVGI